MVVSYRLSIVTVALSVTIRPQFAIECLQRSNQQGVGHFCGKIGDEVVDRRKPNFNTNWDHGAVVCKENSVDISCHLNTMHEHDRQTDRQTNRPRNGNIDRNRRTQIDCHRCRIKWCIFLFWLCSCRLVTAVETASLQISRHQDTFHFIGDKLLLYSRRLVASDLSSSGLTCDFAGDRKHLANEQRTTTLPNVTETVVCQTLTPCNDHFNKV